jgi:serine/threonine protein kinase
LSEATVVALLAGELSPAERARADAHVDRCPSCLGLVAALGRAEHEDAPERPSSERYVIREEIGAGGMGQVFEAFDAVLRRQVALKCVRSGPEDESAALRFEREMALTARLQHPSIIPVYDAGLFPDGSRYFAMRLVEGDTLDKAIASARTSTQRLALVPGIRRACEAVAYAHENAIVHRDLKPSNILIGPFGETVVLDWGLAKALEDDEVDGDSVLTTLADGDGMTRPGAVMGTVGYIAPEVAQGEAAGPRSDVFSLGSVLAKLLPPRDGDRTEADNDLAAIVSSDAPRVTPKQETPSTMPVRR